MTSGAQRLTELGDAYFETRHRYDPFNATLLGLSEYDGLVGDPSAEASARAADAFAAMRAELAELDTAGFTEAQLVDAEVLEALLRNAEDDARDSIWARAASSAGYASRQGTIFQAIAAVSVDDDLSAERYLQRLGGLGDYFRGLAARYRHELAAGFTPTRLAVTKALGQLRTELGDPSQAVLLRPAAAATDPSVRQRAERFLEDSVRPGIATLIEAFENDLLPVARDDDHVGIREVPGGDEMYARALRNHTTTDLTPEQIHQLGLDVLAQLEARWADVGQAAFGVTDRKQIVERLRTDPDLRFQTTDEIVEVATAALKRAEEALPRYFPADWSVGPCDTVELTAEESANSAMAYYRPPADDGSRNGAQCLATADPTSRHRWEYESLTFHESVPGHHLQLATSQQLDIPRYRRHLDVEVCGFNEGWGLYSEEFADELGLYSSDVARFGMLSFMALRACRLVVDTGIHYYGWSRQQAVDFMFENTATTLDHVEHEVDRYVSWPGQACAYMVGKTEIQRMRRRAEEALGDAFDLPSFHGAIIGNGAVPLSVADAATRRWQETRTAA